MENLYGTSRFGKQRYANQHTISRVCKTDLLDNYLSRLADNLMLDELLCGEANPLEFLKKTMIDTELQMREEDWENKLLKLKESRNEL